MMRAVLVFLATVALAACSGGGKSASEPKRKATTTTNATAEWKTAHGNELSAALQALSTDAGTITTDAGAGDLSGAMAACSRAKVDVATIQAVAPFPDSQVATHLASAMTHYYGAVTACLSGVSTEAATQIGSEFQQANAELSQMNQRLNTLSP